MQVIQQLVFLEKEYVNLQKLLINVTKNEIQSDTSLVNSNCQVKKESKHIKKSKKNHKLENKKKSTQNLLFNPPASSLQPLPMYIPSLKPPFQQGNEQFLNYKQCESGVKDDKQPVISCHLNHKEIFCTEQCSQCSFLHSSNLTCGVSNNCINPSYMEDGSSHIPVVPHFRNVKPVIQNDKPLPKFANQKSSLQLTNCFNCGGKGHTYVVYIILFYFF
jgi:hypothetical protein